MAAMCPETSWTEPASLCRDIPAGGPYAPRQDLLSSETITEWGQPVAQILARLESAGFDAIVRPFAQHDDPEMEDRLAILARKPGG